MLSAFEFARHHIPIAIAKEYILSEKTQNPTTIRKDQIFLGIEIVLQSDDSYQQKGLHRSKM